MPNEPYVVLNCIECYTVRVYKDQFTEFIQVSRLPRFCDHCAAPYLVSSMEYVVPVSRKEGI